MCSKRFMTAVSVAVALIIAVAYGAVVSANHSWGNYHWARTTSSFDLILVNSTTDDWDGFVEFAVTDWSKSTVLNYVQDLTGSTSSKDRRQCKAPSGIVRICNLAYGYNGWLGIAGISLNTDGHIFTGYTKLNDSYFSSGYYNTADWKQAVTCQELGHDIGLDHQDEDFNNTSLKSCMDYQDPPWQNPNQHDYEQLGTIYAHLDSYDSYAGAANEGSSGGSSTCNAPPGKGCNKAGVGQGNTGDGNTRDEWGISLGRRGNKETFLRIDPDGTRHFTFVTWAERR